MIIGSEFQNLHLPNFSNRIKNLRLGQVRQNQALQLVHLRYESILSI